MKKVKLLTHNDLDGVGCYIVSRIMLPSDYKIDVTYCTHGNIEEMTSEAILHMDEYEKIYMTDIVVYDSYIQQFFTPEVASKFVIIDHHKTALELKKYEFAHVSVEENEVLMSGTYLFYKYLKEIYNVSNRKLERFVENVRAYDTWDWKKNGNQLAKTTNDLMYIKGINDFAEDMIDAVANTEDDLFLNETDWILLKYETQKLVNYIKSKEKDIIDFRLGDNYHFGVVYAEQYVSDLGSQLAMLHPEFDAIAIIGAKTVSLRTIREDVDVSEIAKQYGGGGHQKAAGFPIETAERMMYIMRILKK